MGLFTFIKGLFAKATKLETQVDSFVTDVAKVAPDTATNLRNDLKKVKKVKADTIAQVEKVEAKVKEVEAKVKKATAKAPTTNAKKKTTK
jgi:predicted RecB family endonuclease